MSTEYRIVPLDLFDVMIIALEEEDRRSLAKDILNESAPVPPAGDIPFPGYPPVPDDRKLPPAGGEPEVIASVHGAGYSDHPPMTHWLEIGVEKMPMSGKIETGEKLIFLKDHRAQVIQLQAEVGALSTEVFSQRGQIDKLQRLESFLVNERDALKAEVERVDTAWHSMKIELDSAKSELAKAQESALLDRHEAWKAGELHGLNTVNAELTKARELLHKAGNLMWEMYLGSPTDKVCDAVEDFLNGPYGPPPDQSAPAAKDGE